MLVVWRVRAVSGLELQGAQMLATLLSRVPLHRAKNKFNNVNRYKFEVIVKASNSLQKVKVSGELGQLQLHSYLTRTEPRNTTDSHHRLIAST